MKLHFPIFFCHWFFMFLVATLTWWWLGGHFIAPFIWRKRPCISEYYCMSVFEIPVYHFFHHDKNVRHLTGVQISGGPRSEHSIFDLNIWNFICPGPRPLSFFTDILLRTSGFLKWTIDFKLSKVQAFPFLIEPRKVKVPQRIILNWLWKNTGLKKVLNILYFQALGE